MVHDPIGDLIIQIKNASMAGKKAIELPHSKMKMAVAKILSKEGYIGQIEKTGVDPRAMMHIVIRYTGGVPVVSGVKRISKPGLRLYVNKDEIPTVVGGMGIALISTPDGIMTGRDAKKKGIGGEILCKVW